LLIIIPKEGQPITAAKRNFCEKQNQRLAAKR